YVGSFPDRFAGFAYNASPQDFPCEQLPAEYTFEDHPLVWGTDVYRGPLQPSGAAVLDVGITYFTKLQEGVPLEMTGPITKEQVYNYVQGNWRDGTPLTAGGTGFGGEEVVDFAFPGLPEQEGGWTEREAGNEPGDRKLLTNYGPFDVMPGATNEFILSYTVFDGPGDHLEKVTGLRDQIDELQAYFDACFEVDGFGMPPCTQVLTDTEEAPGHASMSVRVFPNPAQDLLHIEAGGKPFQFQLLNQFGRLVRQGQTAPLNVQDLPAGVYYLQLQIGQQQMVEKIVLQP
ncbi:MAG TPA: T9SS type A sorting domain-containing protein, partial [Phaeodactylibacter sp.]|nr:T9SS type A sorting domain-containing protein [Phaeodactylibacter sp.]